MFGKVSACVTTLLREIALFYNFQISGKVENSRRKYYGIGSAEADTQLELGFEARRAEFGIWRNNAAGDSDIFVGKFVKRDMLKHGGKVPYYLLLFLL